MLKHRTKIKRRSPYMKSLELKASDNKIIRKLLGQRFIAQSKACCSFFFFFFFFFWVRKEIAVGCAATAVS